MTNVALNIKNLTKSFQGKDILTIKELIAYQGDCIGIVGGNGQGKSTLLKLIAQQLSPDEGSIQQQIPFYFHEQMPQQETQQALEELNWEMMSQFNIPDHELIAMSGGEMHKYRLAKTLSQGIEGLLLDEPTSHLDTKSIDYLISELTYFYGTLIIVSHDRYFLNALAKKIWHVHDGEVTEYKGNYDDFLTKRAQEKRQQQIAYEQYQHTKQQITQSILNKQTQAVAIQKVSTKQKNKKIQPSRLSASKSKGSIQKSMNKTVKAMEKRLDRLEMIEKPKATRPLQFPKTALLEMHHPYPIRGENFTLTVGDTVLLNKVNFQFKKGQVTAITGHNGCGKSTFLKAIIKQQPGIVLSKKVAFSVYQQMAYQFEESLSMLAYLISVSDFNETFVRSVLHHLGFSSLDCEKSLSVLSGGEAIRLAIATAFLNPANVLILDEPTNFIDLETIQALENLIKHYPGTILLVSHDQVFIEQVADEIYLIDKQRLIQQS